MPTSMSVAEIVGGIVVLAILALLIEAACGFEVRAGVRLLYVVVALPVAWWAGGNHAGRIVEAVAAPIFAGRPKTPYEAANERLVERLSAIPEWTQRVGGRSARDLFTLGHELGQKGARRLDDAWLGELYVLTSHLIQTADVRTCAGMIRGTVTREQMRGLLERLDPATLERWMEVAFRAAEAELKDAPAPIVSPREQREAAEAFVRLIPADQRDQLRQALLALSLQSATDEEACWLAQSMFYYLDHLSDRQKLAVFRSVAPS